MARSAMLERLKSLLYPFVNQNDVSEAMLIGPAEILGTVSGTLEMLLNDGRHVEPGTVTIGNDLVTLTQVAAVDRVDPNGNVTYKPLVDWTKRFKVGDEIITGGSVKGNNARKVVATVSSGQLTVTTPYTATEAGLLYGKATYALLRRCQELTLYPGGWETDTQLRTDVLGNWLATMQARGSRAGIKTELDRVTNSSTTVLESIPSLTTLGTAETYTQSTVSLSATSWAASVAIGDAITVAGSTRDSNGRYTVYGKTSTTVEVGHRASRSTEYAQVVGSGRVELQFREDRVLNQIGVRLVNTTGSSATVGFTLTATNATFAGGFTLTGTATVSTTSSVGTVTGMTVAAGAVAEVVFRLATVSSTGTFQLGGLTGTTLTAARVGELGLCPMATTGLPDLATLWPWRWGAIVRTGLRSRVNETGLTVYAKTKPGWYLEVSSTEIVEEDAYTMASPDEFVVLEVDHRNPSNYTAEDLETLVREVLLPANVDGVLGLT